MLIFLLPLLLPRDKMFSGFQYQTEFRMSLSLSFLRLCHSSDIQLYLIMKGHWSRLLPILLW